MALGKGLLRWLGARKGKENVKEGEGFFIQMGSHMYFGCVGAMLDFLGGGVFLVLKRNSDPSGSKCFAYTSGG